MNKFQLLAAAMALFAMPAFAADNVLSEKERADGWVLLFDGKTMAGWKRSDLKPGANRVEEGSLNPHRCGAYMLIHEKPWSNFVVKLDFKLSQGCNSGIFLRTFPLLPHNDGHVGYNGIEVAIDERVKSGFHATGAIYDLVKVAKDATKPTGQWNRTQITCDRNRIIIELNGQTVSRMDLDEWTESGERPDGSQHKFTDVAWKSHPRRGYIGLQDHGAPIWFRNIKLRSLK